MDSIFYQIYQYPGITEQHLKALFNLHTPVRYKKGAFLLKEGQTAKNYALLSQGIVRAYATDAAGNEITTQFFCSGEIVIEVSSLFRQIPTEEYFRAETDLELWQISLEDFQQLFTALPPFAEWGRSWMVQALSAQKERMISMIKTSAQQRYLHFMEQNPAIVQQVALKHIASYLGITDTSLSRIRKELSQ